MKKKSILTTHLAVICQSLYLANLLLLPGLSFFILLWLLLKNNAQGYWQRIHLIRAIQLSVIVGVVLIVIPVFVIFFTTNFDTSLMVMIIYFVTFHACFVLIGMLNLSRAMAKKIPLF